MEQRIFQNWKELVKTGYFDLLPDGRLSLTVNGLDGIIDFHTHLGWTFVLAPPIDLAAETEFTIHNFGDGLEVNLDIYSGQNFYEQRPKWSSQDYAACAVSPIRAGKHQTHTIPNIIKEMDALKISQSVCLCIDLASASNNSERAAKALVGQDRLVYYCSVSAKDRRAEQKFQKFIESGAKGIKLHPEIQMVPINSELMLNHLRLWTKISGGKPVLFHSGFNGFEPEKMRKHAAIELYDPAAEALGDTPCVLGHSAMNEYKKAVDIALRHNNVYLETSGQPPSALKYMLDTMGDDRLLFGSDWPVYPQAMPLAKVLIATEGSPQARLKILRDNALKLLA